MDTYLFKYRNNTCESMSNFHNDIGSLDEKIKYIS